MIARPSVSLLVFAVGCSFDRAHLPGTVDPWGRAPDAGGTAPAQEDAGASPADGRPTQGADGKPTLAADGRPGHDTGVAPPSDGPAPRADARIVADAPPPPDTRIPDAPPAPPVPAGCQIVGCDGNASNHGCCTAWYNFGLDSEDRNQVLREDLVSSFSAGATDVRAEYAFDRPGQDGAIGMLLDRQRPVRSVRIVAESSGGAVGRPFVTVEATDGRAGCGYSLGPGGQAEMDTPLFCWGDGAMQPDRINVRLEATGPGPASIRVTVLEVR